MHIIRKFLDGLFSNRKITSEYCWELVAPQPKIDWPYFARELTNQQLCLMRAFSRIVHYMPQEPVYELMDGYDMDVAGINIKNENDLIEYLNYVASSGMTSLTYLLCHKSNQFPDRMGPKYRSLIENMRKLGVVGAVENLTKENN